MFLKFFLALILSYNKEANLSLSLCFRFFVNFGLERLNIYNFFVLAYLYPATKYCHPNLSISFFKSILSLYSYAYFIINKLLVHFHQI